MTPMQIEQCEGCANPLAYYLEEWQWGEVEVTWMLCGEHAHQAETSQHSEY